MPYSAPPPWCCGTSLFFFGCLVCVVFGVNTWPRGSRRPPAGVVSSPPPFFFFCVCVCFGALFCQVCFLLTCFSVAWFGLCFRAVFLFCFSGPGVQPTATAGLLGDHARAGTPVVRQPRHHAVVGLRCLSFDYPYVSVNLVSCFPMFLITLL